MTKKEVKGKIEEKITDRLEFAKRNWNTWLHYPEETREEKKIADMYKEWAEQDKARGYELIELLEEFGFITVEEVVNRKNGFYCRMIGLEK